MAHRKKSDENYWRTNRHWTKSKIINALRTTGKRGMTLSELIEELYGNDERGGPDDPALLIQTHIYYLRQMGFPIKTARGYKLPYRYQGENQFPEPEPGPEPTITTLREILGPKVRIRGFARSEAR